MDSWKFFCGSVISSDTNSCRFAGIDTRHGPHIKTDLQEYVCGPGVLLLSDGLDCHCLIYSHQ